MVMYPKDMFFKIVQIGYMNGCIMVVWESLHIVKYDPVYDEYTKA